MAEPASVRQRRSRAHRAGIHAYCLPGGKCSEVSPARAPVPVAADFGPPGQELWDDITGSYELSPPERAILRRACRCLDRLDRIDFITGQSAPAIKVPGGGLRANPVYKQADETERTFDMLIRSLALPMADEAEGVIRSPDQRAKAQAKWRKYHEDRDRGALA